MMSGRILRPSSEIYLRAHPLFVGGGRTPRLVASIAYPVRRRDGPEAAIVVLGAMGCFERYGLEKTHLPD